MRLLLNGAAAGRGRRALAALLVVVLWMQAALGVGAAYAQSNGINVTAKICDYPDHCFKSSKERQAWAKANNCQFLEDVCKEPGARFDRGGSGQGKVAKAPEDTDEGTFGKIWSAVKSAAAGVVDGIEYAYSFVKGFWEGVKKQITDLAELIANPMEFAKGLLELGKAFIKDPAGTIKAVGETLAQDVIDQLNRATRCGAWDLGAVLGENISPAVMLKVAGKLNRYAGDLKRAIRDTKIEFGCASFTAGTRVVTADGTVAIEGVAQGMSVFSRDDRQWTEAPQVVTNIFGRVAPGTREIVTEFETYRLTDEHPLWVQGKGWTPAKDVTDDDVLAALKGDVRVRSNTAVPGAQRVYNFSVANTPSYFVGEHGLWVHNAKCSIPTPYRAPKSPSNYGIGSSDGGPGAWVSVGRPPNNKHFNYEKQVSGAPNNIEYEVNGKKFDGYDAKRNVLLDAKDYAKDNPLVTGQPSFLADKFKSDAIADALDQVTKAGSARVEWHVSSREAAEALNALFEADPKLKGRIEVFWNPDVVNF